MVHTTDHFNSSSDAATEKIMSAIGNWMQEGSGWVVNSILKFETKITQYKPLRASSYIPLPKQSIDRCFASLFQNKDVICFMLISLLRHCEPWCWSPKGHLPFDHYDR